MPVTLNVIITDREAEYLIELFNCELNLIQSCLELGYTDVEETERGTFFIKTLLLLLERGKT